MAAKKSSNVEKRQTIVEKRQIPRSLALAEQGIETGQQFTRLMSALITDIITGAMTATDSNAVCNASGKMLKAVEMQHKHGKANGASLKLTT